MKKIITSIMIAVAMLTAINANAETYFFSENGAGEMDGSSWENAAPAEYLGSTVENAVVGDVFCLMAGKYKPDVNTGLWKLAHGITIKGGYPSNMTGTNTDILYPTAGESVFSADIDGDGVGDNGTTAFFVLNNEAGKMSDCAKVTLAGITIRDAYNTTTSTYYGAALMVYHGNIELDHVKFINNTVGYLNPDGTAVGGGAVVAVRGTRLYAHDCVWEGNKSSRAGVALLVRQHGGGSTEGGGDGSIAIVDRCEFTNNTVFDPSNGNVAKYGGTIAVADWGGTMYMNNCTATGSHISWGGAFCRMGGGTTLYSTNNTWYDCTCNYASRYSGAILSCGDKSKTYIANTIAVNKEDGKDGMFSTVFIQSNNCTFETGGYNVWGSLMNSTTSALASTDNVVNTNTMPLVFGSNNYAATGGNGTKVIAAKEDYRGITVSALKELAAKWNLPEEIDVTLDQRGFVRPEVTIAGSYDVNANSKTTGIEAIAVNGEAFKVTTLGQGKYQLAGAEGVANVYDLTGKLVLSETVAENGVINLNNAGKGVYIIRVKNQTVKIIK